ncbi:MAG: glycosyltransferase family 2 protein [Bacteroidales bacterium]|jgi:glycosyltransferase involved in cell wall biosynthesis|nr:glycosyltransferase family 2 protein [Bacteroidales bacterium]
MGKVNDKTDFFKYVDSFAKDEGVNSLLVKGDISSVAPAVTIAIPTYKRPEFIKCAIDSALAQKDFDNYEVVVVDNDPERDTETEKIVCAIDNPKLKYYKNAENLGMFGNMNRCFKLSRTKWVTILHDDDMLTPDYLSSVMGVVAKRPDIDMLSSRHSIMDVDGHECTYVTDKFYYKLKGGICRMRLRDFTYYFPTRSIGCLFNKEKVESLGGFNQEFYPTSDYVFCAIFCQKFKGYDYNRFIYRYRMGRNESANPETYKVSIVNDYYFQLAMERVRGRDSDFFDNTIEANAIRRMSGYEMRVYGIQDRDFAKEILKGKAKKIHNVYCKLSYTYARVRKMTAFALSRYFGGIR